VFTIVAALLWWLAATGHSQEPGIGCTSVVIDGVCETAGQSSLNGPETLVPAAPSRPIITYANGKLTITASNTSLADVLRAITTQTGTVIEFPAGSAADRISVHEGPSTIRQVLVNLLNGSGFNYVIVGSPNAPDVLERVVLANADQPANASPQPASDQSSALDQTKEAKNPLLWTPPTGSSLWTPPKGSSLYTSPEEASSAPALPQALDNGGSGPRTDLIPAEVIQQGMKDRAQQIREQVQPPQ
jgi:hypothetical protein